MPHLLEQAIENLNAVLKPASGGRRHFGRDDLEIELGRGERLADLVMEFASEVAAFLLLDLQQPMRERLE